MASLAELREARLRKLNLLKEKGINPYPISTNRDCTIATAIKEFDALSKKGALSVVGRVTALRPQGGLIFLNFSDGTGTFQGLLREKDTPQEAISLFQEAVDIGDFISVTGTLFTSKRGEKTILVSEWQMLCKSLLPLPEKWHGLTDTEERFRKRYLDTLMNDVVRNRFLTRSRIVSVLRKILDANEFLEVETSILQAIPGGANAEPFKTHHNALDIDLFLRIAPELDLKKLLVGGFSKVYEIGRSFRNEGIDVTHNPEFTTVEWYEAYSDAPKQRSFVEAVLRQIVSDVAGSEKIKFGEHNINFGKKFATITYYDLLKTYAGIRDAGKADRDELAAVAKKHNIPFAPSDSREKLMDAIYKRLARPKVSDPTFIIEYPTHMIPLAKKKEGDEALVDAFQIVVGGLELVKAFSELNDPLDQRSRFEEQEKRRKAGDAEAEPSDETFLEALEHGMPPAGGLAISIDRMTMLLTDTKNIREVIFFPTLRPKN